MNRCTFRTGAVRAAAFVVAAVVVAPWPAPPAHAVGAPQWGWWWRVQQAPVAPPEQPLGALPVTAEPPEPTEPPELMVASAPDGATAIAAVRFAVGLDRAATTLTLAVREEVLGEAARIVACPATGPWEPARGGAWSDRPEHDCGRAAVSGVRAADGGEWSFAVEPLVAGDTLDVVLVPDAADDGVFPTFQVSFHPPNEQSLATTARPTGPTTPPPDGPAIPTWTLPPSAFAGQPFAPVTPLPVTPPTTTAVPSRPTPAGAARDVRPPSLPASPTSRAVGMALLALAAALALVAWRERIPLEPSGTARTGGVGRFVAVRASKPERLL